VSFDTYISVVGVVCCC